jgi:hypothetical protein
MSDDGPPIKKAGAAEVIARPDLDDMLERARGNPKPEPAGECVVCRGPLEQEQVPRRGYASWFGTPGWYCVRCGLRYHHLPSRPPSNTDDDLLH